MDIKKHKEMMLKIAKNLTSTNIEDIKFLCADIGDSILEKIEKPTELIRALEHQGYVGVDNYDNFIGLLGNIGRRDLVNEHFLKLTEKSQSIRNEIVERVIPNGCIFKFDFKECGILKSIDYQLINDNRTSNKLNSLSQEYYSIKEKNGMLYIKVHMSFIKDENIKFSFSFEDLKKKECAVNITDNCKYQYCYKEIVIASPEPIFSTIFDGSEGAESLDWREDSNKEPESIEDYTKDYLKRNFPNYKHVIYVPLWSTYGNSSFVASKFYNLFDGTAGIRAVLPAYPLRCHATSLKCKLKAVDICEDKNRITIFNSDLNLVLIARIADKLECIKSESDNCLNDIVLFVNVYKSLIENKGLIVIGTVVLPSFERELVENELFFQFPNNFSLKKVLFLCKDDIEGDGNLVNWWNSIDKFCFNLKKSMKPIKGSQSNKNLFEQLIAMTVMFMGHWTYITVDKYNHCLPTLESNTQKQIKTLVLNYEQLKAINDNGLKKIVTGGYGSGKSVVGKEIVKNYITKKTENPFKLYYICCNHFSLFQCEMKKFVDNIKKKTSSNVTVVCDNFYELWEEMSKCKNISEEKNLPKLLQYLAEINNNKVDFVLEEISCEHVTDKDAVQLNVLFSSVLKESLVVFIPESVEKNRKLIRDKETHLIQNYCFDKKLMEGMAVFTLENSMRVTEWNCLLIESTKEIINENKTVSKLPNTRMNMTLEKSEEFNLLGEDPNITQDNYTPPFNSKEDDFGISILNDGESTVSNFKLTSNNFYDPDLDHMLKNIADMSHDLDPNTRIETSYCLKPGKIGHSIKGRKPKMLFLPFHDIQEIISLKVLSIILNNFCFKKSRKTVVLCSHINEVHLVTYAIGEHAAVIYSPHLQKYTPTYEEKSEVINVLKNRSKILVTDCKGFSGAEAESVIILVSPEEIFLRHVLVDAMSRSNSHLIILVLGSNDNKDKSVVPDENKTIGSVLNELPKNVVEKFTVQIKNDNRRLWKSDSSVYIGDESEEFVNCGYEEDFNKMKHRIALNTKNYSIYETMFYNLQSNIKNKIETIPESRINDSILIMSTSNVLNSNVLILSSIFQNVAQYFVGTDWSKFARILGLLDGEIDMIDSVYHTTLEKSYQVLIEWRQKNGNVTWQQLKMNLESVERFDIIQKIENDFPDIVTQPESNIYQQQFTEIKTDKRFIHSIIYNQERKNHFCQLVGSDWQILGSLLSIPDYILDFIEHDLKENKDKAYEMLNYWVKLNNLSEGNQEKFTSALVQMNKLSLNEFIADFSNDDAEPIQELGLNNDFNTSDASNNGLELNAKHFDKVAYCIGSDWRRFGRYLSLTDAEIRMIDYDYHKTIDKANQILVKWRQNNGNVTWQQLKRSLKLFHRFDIIWQIENDFPDNVTRPGMTR